MEVICQKTLFQLLRRILQCIRVHTCVRKVAANIPKVSLVTAVTLVKPVYFHKGICLCNLKHGQSDVFEMLLNSFCIFLQCPSLVVELRFKRSSCRIF